MKILKILMLFLFPISYYTQNWNTFEPESIDHWNLKISNIQWESATIKNALEIPYTTFISDLYKNRYNLTLHNIPKNIKGIGFQLSTPKCSKEKCSDLYFGILSSKSNSFASLRQFSETAKAKLTSLNGEQTLTNITNSQTIFSSNKQDLKNLYIGYFNDFYFFQNNFYLKNIGIRFGFLLDLYKYQATTSGIENINSIIETQYQNNPSQNSTNYFSSNLWDNQELDYLEFAFKIKLGINYAYEFLEKNLIFVGIDYHYGYGAVYYKLKEKKLNIDILNLLSSTQNNPLALINATPQSKLTDGPAILEIPGYEANLSYGYKISPNQIVRIIYKYKDEFHNLKFPKIEPDESVNLSALQTGDLTPLLLSELKPIGLLPNSKETIREIGIEYMYKF